MAGPLTPPIGAFNACEGRLLGMTSKWRQLAPHFLAMFVIYGALVIAVWTATGIQSFWVSLAIALVIAIIYPSFTRTFDIAPEPWQR